MSKEKTLEEVRNYVQKVAERKGWVLHNNSDGTLDMLIEGLVENFNKIGYYNCPCRDTHENREKDADIICPCVYARDFDVTEYGRCFCGLFLVKDFDFSQPLGMIPERRPPERDL